MQNHTYPCKPRNAFHHGQANVGKSSNPIVLICYGYVVGLQLVDFVDLNGLSCTSGVVWGSRCGFRTNRSTLEMFFVRDNFKKCRVQNKPLYAIFLDWQKAFDSINNFALWTILESSGAHQLSYRLPRSYMTEWLDVYSRTVACQRHS